VGLAGHWIGNGRSVGVNVTVHGKVIGPFLAWRSSEGTGVARPPDLLDTRTTWKLIPAPD
jgi:hypothetical protein